MLNKNEILSEDFAWDNDKAASEIDFFGGEDSDPTTADAVITAIREDDSDSEEVTADKEKTKLAEESKVKNSLFDDSEVEEEEDEADAEEEEEDDNQTSSPKSTGKVTKVKPVKVSTKDNLEFMKEQGFLDYELEEGTELTEDLAKEILEDKFDEKVEDRVEELLENLPDVVKQINKFALNNGDLTQFFSALTKNASSKVNSKSNIEDTAIQEAVVREELLNQGLDADTIESQIQFYKDSDKLDSVSKKYFDKIVEKEKQDLANLTERQNKAKLAEKESQRKWKAEITSKVSKLEDINGYKLGKKDSVEIPSYMTDKNIKLENGATITQMQQDLYKALQDEEKSILIAKLLKTDFDFTQFSKEATTKVVTQVKQNLQNNTTQAQSAGSSSHKRKKSLSDFFDD